MIFIVLVIEVLGVLDVMRVLLWLSWKAALYWQKYCQESGVEEQSVVVSSCHSVLHFQPRVHMQDCQVQFPAPRLVPELPARCMPDPSGCCCCSTGGEWYVLRPWLPAWWVWSVSLLPAQSPLEVKHEQQGQEGLRHSCQCLCSCPRQDQLVPVSSLMASFLCFLYSHSPLTFLPAFAVFSMSFFFFLVMLLPIIS